MEGCVRFFSISARELTCSVLSEINLSELQKTLDSQGLEVVENQKESVVGRKALADKTKGKLSIFVPQSMCRHLGIDFKKIPDEEKVNAFKGLLKCAFPSALRVHVYLSSTLSQRIKPK